MPALLFTVSETFEIAGRYLFPVPGVPSSVRGIRVGLGIELRKPDGTSLVTEIASIPIVDPYDPKRPIQIGIRGLSKAEIPPGTQVWVLDEASINMPA